MSRLTVFTSPFATPSLYIHLLSLVVFCWAVHYTWFRLDAPVHRLHGGPLQHLTILSLLFTTATFSIHLCADLVNVFTSTVTTEPSTSKLVPSTVSRLTTRQGDRKLTQQITQTRSDSLVAASTRPVSTQFLLQFGRVLRRIANRITPLAVTVEWIVTIVYWLMMLHEPRLLAYQPGDDDTNPIFPNIAKPVGTRAATDSGRIQRLPLHYDLSVHLAPLVALLLHFALTSDSLLGSYVSSQSRCSAFTRTSSLEDDLLRSPVSFGRPIFIGVINLVSRFRKSAMPLMKQFPSLRFGTFETLMLVGALLYWVWIEYLRKVNGMFPYPFFEYMNLPCRVTVCVGMATGACLITHIAESARLTIRTRKGGVDL